MGKGSKLRFFSLEKVNRTITIKIRRYSKDLSDCLAPDSFELLQFCFDQNLNFNAFFQCYPLISLDTLHEHGNIKSDETEEGRGIKLVGQCVLGRKKVTQKQAPHLDP